MYMKVDIVPISSIEIGERFRVEMGNINELVQSIKKEGIIQPLAVCEQPDSEKPYLLLAGGRRMEACRRAGVTHVPVRIYDKDLTPAERRSIELAENLYRKNLEWQEQARLAKEIDKLQKSIYGEKISKSPDAEGWSLRDTAKLIGRSPGSISIDIKLADLLEKVPEVAACKTREEAVKKMSLVYKDFIRSMKADEIKNSIGNTPLDKLRSRLIESYIVGDFFSLIKSVPSESIDIVELDPPFGIDLDEDKKSEVFDTSYKEVDKKSYVDFISSVIKEIYRVMKNSSWLIMWFGPDPWFNVVLEKLRENNFAVRGIPAVWVKPNGQTMRPDIYLASTIEMFFYARKGDAKIVKQGRSNSYIYPPVPPQYKVHPTEKPIEMLQDILSTFSEPGSTCLVPFLGSGNTILAASNIGISAFGYDLSQEFKDRYIIKVSTGKPGEYKSYK